MYIYSKCNEAAPSNNPCNTPALEEEAKDACFLIDNPSDSFRLCRKVVNASRYLEQCKKDYCSASKSIKDPERSKKSALCNSFAAMAAECSENFVNTEWRKANRCRNLKII